jgi:hypothetical protein
MLLFYKTLFLSFFSDNITNNQLHKHNTMQLNLFQKRGKKEELLFMGEKKGNPEI